MVASSRKKNKGKDRKAKKIEAEIARRESARQNWLGWVTGDSEVGITITCHHGCGDIPNDLDHPVVVFLNYLQGYMIKDNYNSTILQTTFELYPQVWNDESYKNMAVDIMTSMERTCY